MSITAIGEELKDLPGAQSLTMKYEDGGAVEAYSVGEKTVRVAAGSTPADIRAALEAE